MTDKRAAEMYDTVMRKIQSDLLPRNFNEIFLSKGKTHLRSINSLNNRVDGHTQIIISDSAVGKKLAKLKNWLWGIESLSTKQEEPGSVIVNTTPQTVILRRRTVKLTTAETIEYLQIGIAEGSSSARQVRNWYADINGENISPKWAAQNLAHKAALLAADFTIESRVEVPLDLSDCWVALVSGYPLMRHQAVSGWREYGIGRFTKVPPSGEEHIDQTVSPKPSSVLV